MGSRMTYNYKKHWENSSYGSVDDHTWDKFITPYLIPGSVLDIGCGSGRFIDFLSKDRDYTGLDISHLAIKGAEERHPDLKFSVKDIVTWEPEGFYDNVFCWTTLEHIPPEHIETVANKISALGQNIIIGEPMDPDKVGSEGWAAHCFNHPYKDLFDVVDAANLGSVWVFKCRGQCKHEFQEWYKQQRCTKCWLIKEENG